MKAEKTQGRIFMPKHNLQFGTFTLLEQYCQACRQLSSGVECWVSEVHRCGSYLCARYKVSSLGLSFLVCENGHGLLGGVNAEVVMKISSTLIDLVHNSNSSNNQFLFSSLPGEFLQRDIIT